MLRLKKRAGSPFWQIVGTCPYTRERVRQSTGVDREDEAKGILASFISRAHNEAVHGKQSQVLFAEAVLEYVGKGGDARFLGPLLDSLGKKRMTDISDQDLTALATKVYPLAKSSTLVRQVYGPVQAVWNAAERAKMVSARNFAKPKIKKTPAKFADDAWLLAVLKSLTKLEQRAAIMFMSFSGARASEVVSVQVQHHDIEAGTVLLQNTKNGDARLVPLPEFVNQALELLPHDKPAAPLFGYKQRFALNNMLRRACDRAQVPYLSPHKAGRHTFAARLLKDGNSLKALQEAGGWKSSSVVANTYAHLERAQVDRAVREVRTIAGTQATQLAISAKNYADKKREKSIKKRRLKTTA